MCGRVLATLVGCTQDSLPPLSPYFDFMDSLWAAPATGLYARDKLLTTSWNRKKPDRPKGKHQKALETKQKITESIEKRLLAGKDIPLLLRFTSAKRHDSFSLLVSFHELEKHMPAVSIENMCLDSAMNNYPTYRILKKAVTSCGAAPMGKNIAPNVKTPARIPNMAGSSRHSPIGISVFTPISPVAQMLIRDL